MVYHLSTASALHGRWEASSRNGCKALQADAQQQQSMHIPECVHELPAGWSCAGGRPSVRALCDQEAVSCSNHRQFHKQSHEP